MSVAYNFETGLLGFDHHALRMDAVQPVPTTSATSVVSLSTEMDKPETICLVACSASKLAIPARAEDLYTGNLFNLSRQYAERFADRWYILSAKFGLVYPCEEIEPYDQLVTEGGRAAMKHWGLMVTDKLLDIVKPEPGANLVFLAGLPYRWPVQRFLHSRKDITTEAPLEHLGIGQQMAYLKKLLGKGDAARG